MTKAGRTGGQILVDALRMHEVDTAFCVPGESFLPVLDGLYEARQQIRLVVARHEAGAANMAEAYGKLTGKPGICLVTRGPGATQGSVGVHTASQDSTPLIMFVGQVARTMLGRESWQEIDLRQMFDGMVKWVSQIEDAARIPELVGRAFQVAVSGRPGPVVLGLPEDMLFSEAEASARTKPYGRVAGAPDRLSLERLRGMLGEAERPIAIVGGGGWTPAACADLRAFVDAFALPTAASFRRQHLLDNRSANYAGHAGLGMNPALRKTIEDSDLILALGPRLGETTTDGYTLIDVPRPRQRLVHVHADPHELGRIYEADLMINAGMPELATALRGLPAPDSCRWSAWRDAARSHYLSHLAPPAMPGPVDLGAVMVHLRETLPEDAVITNGAGNFAIWVHRFYPYPGFRTQLAPTSGAMGYGLPAAIAAKLLHPERTVVCVAGDGCFMMAVQELATACQYELGIVVIVVNNGMYGSIRMHQEKEFPGNVYGTALFNPDFPALAKSYGAFGEVVESTAEFADAFARARSFADAERRPALLELRIDPEAITPTMTLTKLREQAMARA